MRQNTRYFFVGLFALLLTILVLGGVFWGNYYLVRHYGGGAEFYGDWKSAQNFIRLGISPYSELNTVSVQQMVYGRRAMPGENQLHYVSPLYFALLNVPFAMIGDVRIALALWMVFLEAALAGIGILSIQLSGWRPNWFHALLLFLFTFLWLPGVAALRDGNSIILQTLLLLGALRVAEYEIDELAGAFLALAMVHAEALAPALLLVLFWAASARRWRIWGGFLMSTILMGGIAFILLPAWPGQFVRALVVNWATSPLPTLLNVFVSWFPALGGRMAQVIIVLVISIVLLEWYFVRERSIHWLFWTISLTLTATPLLGLPISVENLVALSPAFILAFSVMDQRWGAFGRWAAIVFEISLFALFWFLGARNGVETVSVLLTVPVILFVLLYWVRWWVARPPRLWAEISTRRR